MLSFLANCWRQFFSSPVEVAPPLPDTATKAEFDAEWYLAAYPDVAQAGVDPWEHYQRHGAEEGRLPRRNRALAWDHALWRGAHAVMLPRLHALLDDAAASADEQRDARWALARWFAWQQQWEKIATCLLPQSDPRSVLTRVEHPRMALLAVEALCRLQLEGKLPGTFSSALPTLLDMLKQRFPDQADTYLADANSLLVKQASDKPRLEVLNHLFTTHGLSPIAQQNTAAPLALDNLTLHPSQLTIHPSPFTIHNSPLTIHPSPLTTHPSPLISVIVPLHNAEHTIGTALRSLFEQQSVRLEIIVVDDASEDSGAEEVAKWQEKAPEHVALMVIQHATNQGAYAARNTGLVAATGDFITTHDSDDWSHPQKLVTQWQALEANPAAKACLSHWVRVTPELLFHRWRLDDDGWVYPNISSLMLRREVIDTLGFWDEVSINADTEYRERVEAVFGIGGMIIALPGVPLAFGRADEGSLSQHSRSHLATQFAGLRYRYMQSARRWHASAKSAQQLYMPQYPEQRLFVAPPVMLRGTGSAQARFTEVDEVSESSLFEAGWYLERYIDLQQARVEPLEHFYTAGVVERRDPGPHFSLSGYCRRYPEVVGSGQHPLAHYMMQGHAEGLEALPIWQGEREFSNRPTIMLCAHQAGASLFGAERSLLDVLDAMGELQWNVIVTLPEANNVAYEQALLTRCKALAVLPYGWWQVGRAPVSATVGYFRNLIQRYSVKAVHGNTIVLDEPYVAAKLEGVATLTHVRELPAHDEALCSLLGAAPEQIVAHVHQHADVIMANSHCVARAFERNAIGDNRSPSLCVVPNTIEMAPLLTLPEVAFDAPHREGVIRVGMLSSNIAKKGLTDVEAMAVHLQTLAPNVDVALFGTHTTAIEALLRRQAQGNAPANITFAGYVGQPAEALGQLDIVVNLSRFQESFGRTVLEAMAAARPVVAYDWGALNELVVEGETGFLVPFSDPLAAAQRVAKLANAPGQCRELGQAGRKRAQICFNAVKLRDALVDAYRLTRVSEFI
ncbi:glycosyltransferase [Halomonas sp. SpR8]|uniref:glycosyltransferase n=1 Tax=Halomonas sp. SpR8 TaxID=3050463 RepID=UPI0027E4212A|nr:glycosyltransferase [Halomonas sp. SpR8]MDQ7727293.1 glycosyltransferase [Halomonas sp. SpR8]